MPGNFEEKEQVHPATEGEDFLFMICFPVPFQITINMFLGKFETTALAVAVAVATAAVILVRLLAYCESFRTYTGLTGCHVEMSRSMKHLRGKSQRQRHRQEQSESNQFVFWKGVRCLFVLAMNHSRYAEGIVADHKNSK